MAKKIYTKILLIRYRPNHNDPQNKDSPEEAEGETCVGDNAGTSTSSPWSVYSLSECLDIAELMYFPI